MSQSQSLRAIVDFWGKNFVIPNFYCLQPIVVKKSGEKYNVIDGQQRLTTIFLIIKFLQNEDYFTITYQSRLKSAEFLKNIGECDVNKAIGNIDFFYFLEAYNNIKLFFQSADRNKKRFENTLLDRCKVLWYEINQKENENEVFIRLNIGKIPLVEAENIKALFLSKNDELDSEDLKERAELWYRSEIEARENRDFRYCVLNQVDKKYIENKNIKDDILRIEAYLKAIVPAKKSLFDYFYECYKNGKLNEKWNELESAINTLPGFAGGKENGKIDREIFHYLGFLILNGENINSLYGEWKKDTNKKMFAEKLLEIIQKKI
ncbi:DUF262 domain-containing protein [Campylobacter helveticus]|uniref:DUF262 domain-containing protein n=1 Tax=Campylobacter helveticus TaxID=28898 RepID=UPI002149C7DE|nr:DUF262 domain-containing protein [Campylobacter helveticus]MCR2057222.1 DUF262 domain-containing protein [Campylobacter helveticus]